MTESNNVGPEFRIETFGTITEMMGAMKTYKFLHPYTEFLRSDDYVSRHLGFRDPVGRKIWHILLVNVMDRSIEWLRGEFLNSYLKRFEDRDKWALEMTADKFPELTYDPKSQYFKG